MLICLHGFTSAYGIEALPDETVQETQAATEKAAAAPQEAEKNNGFSVFLVVFLIAVLFVLSSATALKGLGGKPPARRTAKPSSPRKLPEGNKRFRL